VLTVPEAARRASRNPETIRRWIRSGLLRAHKIGTQHIIEEADLDALTETRTTLPVPDSWTRTATGEPMPDILAELARSRAGH
jgi:excisionase family DNA binding protein